MNLRDWLIIIGVVIIVGIVLDGLRRMRLARKDSLQMSRDMGGEFENTPIDDGFNPELPSGGARIIGDAIDSGVLKVNVEDSIKKEPLISAAHENDDQTSNDRTPNSREATPADEFEQSEPLTADASARIEVETIEIKTAHAGQKPKRTIAEVESTDTENQTLVVVINVHAQTHQGFPGTEVKKLLEACGLDHGDMSIFHRHEEDDLLSPIQFSVANAIEPGYFDPKTLGEISTPGVSFFMTLPGPKDYSKAFEYMLETAQCFARNLKGELKDEQLSVMTSQTIEHCRHQIKEFERSQLSKTRT